MLAIILAGGQGSRLRAVAREKALITFNSSSGTERKLIDIVVNSVQSSRVDEFCVAVTRNTPETMKYCKTRGYTTFETPGEGYIEDVWFLLRSYPEFISITCDLPFLRPVHINALIEAYAVHQSSITGAVPVALFPEGITPSHTFTHNGRQLVPCGLNVVTSSHESVPYVFDEPLLAVNVNTRDELAMARRLVRRNC
ncbi:MAG: NTP transferase domain-containing protein [Candidatus Methanospirareceae archaeon]